MRNSSSRTCEVKNSENNAVAVSARNSRIGQTNPFFPFYANESIPFYEIKHSRDRNDLNIGTLES